MGQSCYSFVLLLKGAEHLLLIRTGHLVLGSVPESRFIMSLYRSCIVCTSVKWAQFFLSLIQQANMWQNCFLSGTSAFPGRTLVHK